MFSIPTTFAKETETHITLPALKLFAKNKKQDELKTTTDRRDILNKIEKYANSSSQNEEEVQDWLDKVLIEGIKDVYIKYLNPEYASDVLLDDDLLKIKVNKLLNGRIKQHLSDIYTEDLKLFRYEVITSSENGRSIRFYLGKLVYCFDKKNLCSSATPYPIFVEIYVDKGVIVARAKPKSGMYKYTNDFNLESAESTTLEKQIENAIDLVCDWFEIKTLSYISAGPKFRNHLYFMLEKYTKTPQEISQLILDQTDNIENLVDSIMNDICHLSDRFKDDVHSSIINMIEKYFSISYPQKSIFIKDRNAYPLKLNATDEEDSRVEQTAAFAEPLQSKAIFFDNKKMLQMNQTCDEVTFVFNRLNSIYCSKNFKVKITVKKDFCTLKFTEYTMEEDIINVLFSLISTSGLSDC